uniref:Putative secreted protein n=1 Tax=Anopheles marajoara TaxID=58244 RepID=A0A2M4CC53_9DIPT
MLLLLLLLVLVSRSHRRLLLSLHLRLSRVNARSKPRFKRVSTGRTAAAPPPPPHPVTRNSLSPNARASPPREVRWKKTELIII